MEEVKMIIIKKPIHCLENGIDNIVNEKELFIRDYLEGNLEKGYTDDLVEKRLSAYNEVINEYISAINIINKYRE